MKLEVSLSPTTVAQQVADWLLAVCNKTPGDVRIALSGGSTPQLLYQTLTQTPYRDQFPWDRVHWFWGDERYVPQEDPMSNYGMVKKALLDHAPIAATHIHPITTRWGDIATAAMYYEATLKEFYRQDPSRPLFDVTFLGLGPDGHTASLFPGQPVLQEQKYWVGVCEPGLKPFVPRITLTFPALNSSRHAVFLICGADKQIRLQELLRGDSTMPAAGIQPLGELYFFVDQAAYGGTTQPS